MTDFEPRQRTNGRSSTIRDEIDVMLRQKWLILAATSIAVIAAILFTLAQEKTYRSTASVLVRTPETAALFPLNGANGSVRSMIAEREFVESSTFTLGAEALSEPDTRVTVLVSLDSVESKSTSSIEFLAESSNPESAAATAQAWAEHYVDTRHQFDIDEAGQSIDTLQASLAALEQDRAQVLEPLGPLDSALATATDANEIARLSTERLLQLELLNARLVPIDDQIARLSANITELQVRLGLFSESELAARVLQSAPVPEAPFSPSVPRNALFALLAGFLVGTAAAFTRESSNVRLRTPDEITDATGLMHLASVPKLKKSGVTPGLRDSYQRVLSALDLSAGAGNPTEVVLVTSAVAGEGKTSTAVELARLSSLGGNRTLLIEADLHRPQASNKLDVANRVGLVDYLTDRRTMDAITFPTELVPNLSVIPSGRLDKHDAVDLLRSPALSTLFEKARGQYDRIVVDGAPLLAVVDSIEIAILVDTVLFVVGSGLVQAKQLIEADELLRRANVHSVGAVLVGVDDRSDGLYSYGYERRR